MIFGDPFLPIFITAVLKVCNISIFRNRGDMKIRMIKGVLIKGALVAGMTSEGGGAVAFPVNIYHSQHHS